MKQQRFGEQGEIITRLILDSVVDRAMTSAAANQSACAHMA